LITLCLALYILYNSIFFSFRCVYHFSSNLHVPMHVTFVGMIQCVMCNFVLEINRQMTNFLIQTMAHQVENGSAFEASEYLEVQSSEWSSFISSPLLSSESDDDVSSGPYAFCQCEDEDTLFECSAYGSFFEPDTHCPGC
jgi:hypothetical protein